MMRVECHCGASGARFRRLPGTTLVLIRCASGHVTRLDVRALQAGVRQYLLTGLEPFNQIVEVR
jgi:hypothetical protein